MLRKLNKNNNKPIMYLSTLGFYRFVAALIVVIYHFRYVPEQYRLDFAYWSAFDGIHMVTFFFVLTGFVNTLAYGPRLTAGLATAKAFWLSRAARILPMYIATLFVMLGLLGLLGQHPSLSMLIAHVTLMQAWFPAYSDDLNFVTWTLSVDIFLYAITPLLLVWLGSSFSRFKRLSLLTLAVFCLSQAVLIVIMSQSGFPESKLWFNFVHHFPLFHLSSFLWGVLAAWLVLNPAYMPSWLNWKGLGIVILLLIIVANLGGRYASSWLGVVIDTPSSYAPLFFVAAICLSRAKGGINQLLSAKLFQYLGNLSYGIYILQLIVWVLYSHLVTKFLPALSAGAHLGLGLLLLILVAMLFYHAIEKPCYYLIRQKALRKSKKNSVSALS